MLNRKRYRVFMKGQYVGIAIYASNMTIAESGSLRFTLECPEPEIAGMTQEWNVAIFDGDSVEQVYDLSTNYEYSVDNLVYPLKESVVQS